jgi:hypothetical protein
VGGQLDLQGISVSQRAALRRTKFGPRQVGYTNLITQGAVPLEIPFFPLYKNGLLQNAH